MKKLLILSLIVLSFHSNGGVLSLPLGGELTLSANEWNIQETKGFTGVNSILFAHKKLNQLQGVLLDGSVKDKGDCTSKRTEVCDRIIPMGNKLSYQIIAQRFHGNKTYQNYVIAFTLEKGQQKKFLPILKDLKDKMEFNK